MSIELSLFDPKLTYTSQKKFDCEHAVINSFVHSFLTAQVKKNLSVAYVLTDASQHDRFVGFLTLAQHAISASLLVELKLGSLPRSIPCARLVMLGIDKDYKKQQLGSKLLKHAFKVTKSTATQMGCFGLYLDADAFALGFYLKLGFTLLEGDKSPAGSPMFIALKSIP